MSAGALITPAVLMTMTDIAELAGVQRPVVTNWRRRHRDFPAPAGGDEGQPLFDPRAVARWLLATNRIGQEQAEQELALFMLAGLAARYNGPDVMAALTALLCLRFLAGESDPLYDGAGDPVAAVRSLARKIDPNDELLLAEIRAIPAGAGWLVCLVDDLVEASWNCREAFERVMTSRRRFGAGPVSAAAISPNLARLVSELSGAAVRSWRGGPLLIADPAAGAGDLLAAVADILGPDAPPAVAAAEPDPALARLLRRRLAVHGISDSDLDLRAGAELPDDCGTPDVIVTHIPYQPGEARDSGAVLNVLGDVAVRLTAGRFGVVIGPAEVLVGELPPFSHEERTRADILASDMVEAVIRLPGGLVPFRPGYETALWVLTQARDSRWRGRVLLADVSDRELTHQVISDLVEDVVTWRREGYRPGAHQRVFGQQVEVRDLVSPPRPLTVSGRSASLRGRSTDAARRVNIVTQCGVDLDRIGATATADRRPVPSAAVAAADVRPPAETLGSLIRSRRLILRKGTRLKPEHVGRTGHHVVLGADEVIGTARPGQRRVDRAVFARAYPNARLTEPGDILATVTPHPAAIVDPRGYAIAEYPVRVLRIPAGECEQFTSRVLAALLFGDGTGSRATGAVRAGLSLEDHRVILLTPGQVRELDRMLAGIDQRRDLIAKELALLDEMQHAAIGGLIDGTLTLTTSEQTGQDQ